MTIKFIDTLEPNGPFGIVNDTDVVGGFHVVADAAERLAIPESKQKVGMRVYQQDTGVLFVLGSTSPSLTDSDFEVSESIESPGVLTGCVPSNPSGTDFEISPGSFQTLKGKTVVLSSTATPAFPGDGLYFLAWDDSAQDIAFILQSTELDAADMPFAVVQFTGGDTTYFRDISMRSTEKLWDGTFSVSSDSLAGSFSTNFDTIAQAVIFISSFGGNSNVRTRIHVAGPAASDVVTDLGECDLFATGEVLFVSSGTRWKREIAVGDYVAINSVQYEVTTVNNDGQIFVDNPAGTTVGGVQLQRINSSSRYSDGIDITMPGVSSKAIESCFIDGSNPELQGVGRAQVSWGGSGYVSYKPFFYLGNQPLKIEGIDFAYAGEADVTNREVCFLYEPGSTSTLRNVSVDCGDNSPFRTLTCVVHIDPFGPQGLSVSFDNCEFSNLNGIQTRFFNVEDSGANQTVVFKNGSLNSQFAAANNPDCIVFYESTPNTKFIFDNVQVSYGWSNSIAISQSTFGNADHSVVFSNSSLITQNSDAKIGSGKATYTSFTTGNVSAVERQSDGSLRVTLTTGTLANAAIGDVLTISGMANPANNGSFTILRVPVPNTDVRIYNPNAVDETGASGTWLWDLTEDEKYVRIENSFLSASSGSNDIYLRGLASGVALRTFNVGNIISSKGIVVGSDFTPVLGLSDEGFGAITDAHLSGVAGRSSFSKGNHSQIFSGLELTPEAEILPLTNNHYYRPSFKVHPGVMVLPNGLQARVGATTPVPLFTGAGSGSSITLIEGGGISTPPDTETNVYFFLRRKADDRLPTVQVSLFPPQLNGAFDSAGAGSSPGGGYVDEDFGYIGMCQFWNRFFNDTAVNFDEDFAHSTVFRNFSVVYLGNGIRQFTPVDIERDDQTFAGSPFSASGTPAETNLPFSAPIGGSAVYGTNGKYKTARAINLALALRVQLGSGESIAADFGLRGVQGFCEFAHNAGAGTQTYTAQANGTVSVYQGSQSLHGFVNITNISGSIPATMYATLTGVIEDLNEMQVIEHGPATWPKVS